MDRNRVIDKFIEIAIGLALTSTVAVLSGLRKDINQLNDTMITVVQRLALYEQSFVELRQEVKDSSKDLDSRVRILEIAMSSNQKGKIK